MPESVDFAEQLGFTQRWRDLGIIDDVILAELQTVWDAGEDRHSEHYRYRVFCQFLEKHRPLNPELAIALFELGDSDPDHAMGGSIMARIIRLPERPAALVKTAMHSDREHLVKLANKRLSPIE